MPAGAGSAPRLLENLRVWARAEGDRVRHARLPDAQTAKAYATALELWARKIHAGDEGRAPTIPKVMASLRASAAAIDEYTADRLTLANALYRRDLRLIALARRRNGGEGAVVQAEMNTLFRYWSRPEMASTVRPDSFKVAFACAVDATLDSEFNTARQFVRAGAFLRDFAKHGGAQMFADYTMSSEPNDEVMARYAESQECLHQTRTDRGLKIYLAKQLHGTCTCIAHDAIDALERTPKTGKCQACQKQLPASQLKTCNRCGRVEYCGRECLKSDWKAHKKTCRARASGTGSAVALS